MPESDLPLLGEVVISVPRGVTGPALAGRPSAPVGTNFAVYSISAGDWLSDVIGIELTVGTMKPFPGQPQVILTRISKDGKPIGDLSGNVRSDGEVRERYAVAGFTVDENSTVNFRHDEVRGRLVKMCSCPSITGGVVAHRPDCHMRTVTSDGH